MDKTTYRADIDGLRAVAVLSVVIFHFIGSALPNGYLGVDIFFVISGFLITGIIHKSCLTQSFSLKEFYVRRIRRLFPAFICVLTVSSIAAYILFIPSELLPFSKSSLAALGFISNVFFYNEAGYFDAHSQLKPMLHTWSLAVEEQFYIVFPLLLMALHKWFFTHIKTAIALLIGISLASYFCTAFYLHNLDLAFYMLPMRAWELLIGSYVAIITINAQNLKISATKSQIFSAIGAALILLSLVAPENIIKEFLTQIGIQTNPNEASVILNATITLGTALLIYIGTISSKPNAVSKVLSLQPAIFIGKISYSLYLWHWPLYVFAAYYFLDDIPKTIKIFLICTSILTAYFSWRFIEQPVRKNPNKLRKITLIRLGCAAAIILIISNILIIKNNGVMPHHKSAGLSNEPITIGIQNPTTISDQDGNSLGIALGNFTDLNNISFVLLGDSHADAISPALDTSAKSQNRSGLFVLNTCLMTSEFAQQFTAPKMINCGDSTDKFLEFLDDHKNIKTVFMAQRWLERTLEWKEAYQIQNPFVLRQDSLLNLVKLFERKGVNVIILEQVPALKMERNDAISIYWRLKIRNQNTEEVINPNRKLYIEKLKPINDIFNVLEQNTNAEFISVLDTLCPEQALYCAISNKLGLWYYDDDHLSTYGATTLAPEFAQ